MARRLDPKRSKMDKVELRKLQLNKVPSRRYMVLVRYAVAVLVRYAVAVLVRYAVAVTHPTIGTLFVCTSLMLLQVWKHGGRSMLN
jgi:accessory gene regulator protein AgrB